MIFVKLKTWLSKKVHVLREEVNCDDTNDSKSYVKNESWSGSNMYEVKRIWGKKGDREGIKLGCDWGNAVGARTPLALLPSLGLVGGRLLSLMPAGWGISFFAVERSESFRYQLNPEICLSS